MTEQTTAAESTGVAETVTTSSSRRAANVRRAEVQPLIDAYNTAARELPASNATRAAGNAMVLVVRYLERALDDAAHVQETTPTGRRRQQRAARVGSRA